MLVACALISPELKNPPRNVMVCVAEPEMTMSRVLLLESSGAAVMLPRLMKLLVPLASGVSRPIVMLPADAAGVISRVGALTPLAEMIALAMVPDKSSGPLLRMPPEMLLPMINAEPDSAFAAVEERLATPTTLIVPEFEKVPSSAQAELFANVLSQGSSGPAITMPLALLPTAV